MFLKECAAVLPHCFSADLEDFSESANVRVAYQAPKDDYQQEPSLTNLHEDILPEVEFQEMYHIHEK